MAVDSMRTPPAYGWSFGPADIIRIHSDPKLGVWLYVTGAKERVEIRVTKSGLLRVGPVIKSKRETPK